MITSPSGRTYSSSVTGRFMRISLPPTELAIAAWIPFVRARARLRGMQPRFTDRTGSETSSRFGNVDRREEGRLRCRGKKAAWELGPAELRQNRRATASGRVARFVYRPNRRQLEAYPAGCEGRLPVDRPNLLRRTARRSRQGYRSAHPVGVRLSIET